MLYYAIATLHVLVCVILVLVVLLQSGKGADLSAFGGGATQTAFGSRGPASFLSKMTTMAAVVFMLTSIGLAMVVTEKTESKSILETTGTESSEPAKAPAQPKRTEPIPTEEQIQRRVEELQKQKQQAAPAPKPEESKQPGK